LAKLKLSLEKVNKMDKQKFNLILDGLLEKTVQEKLEWETTADKNTFLMVLKDSAVSIRQNYEMTHISYTFEFRNANGEVVDSVTVFKVDRSEREKARRIFDLASRQSLKPDPTVDRILEQLAA